MPQLFHQKADKYTSRGVLAAGPFSNVRKAGSADSVERSHGEEILHFDDDCRVVSGAVARPEAVVD